MAESDADLPKALVKRIVKNKLAEIESTEGGKKDYQITKDALLAFSESAKVFITFIAACANDICKEGKRQIISAEDIFQALDESDFPEFVEPLKAYLEEHRASVKEQRSKKKEESHKRKLEQAEKASNAELQKSAEAAHLALNDGTDEPMEVQNREEEADEI